MLASLQAWLAADFLGAGAHAPSSSSLGNARRAMCAPVCLLLTDRALLLQLGCLLDLIPPRFAGAEGDADAGIPRGGLFCWPRRQLARSLVHV